MMVYFLHRGYIKKVIKTSLIAPVVTFFFATSEPVLARLYVNNYCYTAGVESGDNVIDITLASLRPFYDVEVGAILGTASASGSLQCNDEFASYFPGADFTLQIDAGTGEATEICATPLDGVGVRYRERSGRAIPCNKWGELFTIHGPTPNSHHNLSVDGVVEFVRTKKTTSMKPGLHSLEMPPQTKINSFWPGHTSGDIWGSYRFISNSPLLVAECSIIGVTNLVDFGHTLIDDIGTTVSEHPFLVNFGGCGNENALTEYNNVANIRFQSANIRSDGNLGNGECSSCAHGVAIEVKNRSGEKLNLNEVYKMSSGGYDIEGNVLTHYFSASLQKTPDEPTPGIIETSLTVIITTM